MKRKFSQKGLSLCLAVIILAIILSIVLGLTTILLGQIKIIRGMGYSVVALYAADTGIEQVLKIIINDGQNPAPRYPDSEETELDNEASYVVDVVCCDSSTNTDCELSAADCSALALPIEESCVATKYCVRSVGTFEETQRAIEVKIYPVD